MTPGAGIGLARVYERPPADGRARLLVDRLWPRGVSKADLALDEWLRDIAPSAELRRWFGHDPTRWDSFRERYRAELDQNADAVERCLSWLRRGPVLLLFSARDPQHNQAVVLRDYLTERMGSRASPEEATPGGDAGSPHGRPGGQP